jgi:hypothetical protein
MKLTEQELEQFHELGYLVKPGVYDESALAPIREALASVVHEAALRLQSDGELDAIFEDESLERRLARICKYDAGAGNKVYLSILGKGGGGYSGPAMFDMIMHPPLLGCIESILGPELIGSSVYRVRPKLPGSAHGEVPWHQDAGYNLAHCDRHLIVTCWIPLVDATIENGCLYVVPGVHKGGILQHYTGGHGGFLEIPREELTNANAAIPIVMRAGDVLFLTNKTPHASFENSTEIVRWSVDLRYQNPETPTNVGERPSDYTPERDPVTMACYPPEADFVIRSPSHLEREVRTHEEFHALREVFEKEHVAHPGRGWTALAER